jgi:hypothetical protein
MAIVFRDLAYLTGVLGMSIVGATLWITGVSVTASLLVLVIGGAVWLGTAQGLRWLAGADRRLAGWYLGRPVTARYRPLRGGMIAQVRTITADPRTWRDLAWAIGNSLAGFAAATAALTVSGVVIGYLTTPLWWWAMTDPHHQYATLNLGVYTVTSLPLALLTSSIGLALLGPALALNHAVAGAHARWAERTLSR